MAKRKKEVAAIIAVTEYIKEEEPKPKPKILRWMDRKVGWFKTKT